jgi:uncharacterized protein YraI
VPYGSSVTIYGCMSSVNWCDVSFAGGRGWVSGSYVQASYQSNRVYVEPDYYGGLGIPQVTFDVDRYWGTYYRDRNFYRDRNRWRDYNWRAERPLPPPPRWDDGRRPPPPRWDDGRRPPPPPGWDRNGDRDQWDVNRDRDRDRDRNRDRDRSNWDNNDRRPPPPGWDQGDRNRDGNRDGGRDQNRNQDRNRDNMRPDDQRPQRAERPQREEQRPQRDEQRPPRAEQPQQGDNGQEQIVPPRNRWDR